MHGAPLRGLLTNISISPPVYNYIFVSKGVVYVLNQTSTSDAAEYSRPSFR
jgi:hypothetical protein